MKHELESRMLGEISITSDMQITLPLWQKGKRKMMKMKEESEKVYLKLNIQKTKTMASGPITSCQIEGEKVEAVTDFLFLVSKITVDFSHEIKRRLLLGMTNLDSILRSKDITLRQKSVESELCVFQ